MIEFYDFQAFVSNSIEIILLDLEKLKDIGDKANESNQAQTTTLQTTIRPDDKYFSINSEKISRCAIPISMICFSVIDMIGQWLNEKAVDDFGISAHSFFFQLAKKDDLKNDKAKNKIKEIFRNGIMHSFFAIQGNSVTYPAHENNSLFLVFDEKGTTLDVKYLLNTVEIGLKNLKEELINHDSKLSITAYKGYLLWSEKWKKI